VKLPQPDHLAARLVLRLLLLLLMLLAARVRHGAGGRRGHEAALVHGPRRCSRGRGSAKVDFDLGRRTQVHLIVVGLDEVFLGRTNVQTG